MAASLDLWTRFVNYWQGLPGELRYGIVAGLVVAAVAGAVSSIRNALVNGLKRLFKKSEPPAQSPPTLTPPPAKHELTIKVEQSSPTTPALPSEPHTSQAPAPLPEFPRQPAVPFIERSDKGGQSILAQLKEKLAPGNDRLVALWGSGGVGKTRLAIEAVHALKESFGNRIVWVSADGRPDFTLSTLLDGIATQLNRADLRQLAPEPKQEQICALVAASHALVILDNFETVAPDERVRCRDFLAQRLSCPALITTRDFIVSNFVDNISIEEMSDDEARKFLDELAAHAPARIAFDEETRARIIKTATAIPLVMQWVVQQIILTQRPQDVLNKLSQGKSSAARRVFDSSFELPQVGDDGRAALLALALFTPSAARDALAVVAGFGNDLERLDQAVIALGSLRLVKTVDGGERLAVEGLTRELALAHLSEDSRAEEFRQRFNAYFLQYAKARNKPTPEDYNALEAEKDNLLSATDAAFARGDWESVMSMAYAIASPAVGMLSVRGYWDEALRISEIALNAARASNDEANVAGLAINAAGMYNSRGELSDARKLYDESLEIKKRLNDQLGVANALFGLGNIATDKGDLNEAHRLYGESLEIKKRLGDQNGVAEMSHQLAIIAKRRGDLNEAHKLYSESLEIKKRLGDQNGVAKALHELGSLAQAQGNLVEARQLYDQSLEIKKRLGNQSGIAITLHALGKLAQARGELDEARKLYGKSLVIRKWLGDQSGIAVTLDGLGLLEKEEGNVAEAVRLLREALSIFERLGSPYAEEVRQELEGLKDEA